MNRLKSGDVPTQDCCQMQALYSPFMDFIYDCKRKSSAKGTLVYLRLPKKTDIGARAILNGKLIQYE